MEYTNYPLNISFMIMTSFDGSHTNTNRTRLVKEFARLATLSNLSNEIYMGGDWYARMLNTLYYMTPRGYGRTSYRLSEVIQCGRIPIYMYDDIPWFPYQGSNYSIEALGFLVTFGESMSTTIQTMKTHNDSNVISRLEKIKKARYYYTYPGVIEQIDKFIQDPSGNNGGYLKCHPVPNSRR